MKVMSQHTLFATAKFNIEWASKTRNWKTNARKSLIDFTGRRISRWELRRINQRTSETRVAWVLYTIVAKLGRQLLTSLKRETMRNYSALMKSHEKVEEWEESFTRDTIDNFESCARFTDGVIDPSIDFKRAAELTRLPFKSSHASQKRVTRNL